MTVRASRRGATTRGSVLMLMPAAVLIVLLLGAIAVDSAIVYLGQRQAYNVAFDAANDAAGAGFDADIARTTGVIVYDPDRLRALAADAIGAAGVGEIALVSATVETSPTGEEAVVVTVDGTVRHLFVQAFGQGANETIRISARARGETRGP